MNFKHIKHLVRGHKTIAGLIQWQELYQYAIQGAGLELAQISPEGAQRTVLVLAPHQSDEVFGCGGAIAFHRKKGDAVHVVYLTDGSRGTPSGRVDKTLVAIREQEAMAGLHVLGEAETVFWRFPDTTFAVNKTTTGLLKGMLEKIQPDIIYIPWYGDDHPDHFSVVPLMVEVLPIIKQGSTTELWQYEVWTPLVANRILPIGDVLEEKIRAMDAHQSQAEPRLHRDGILGLNTYRGAFAGLKEPAEAYLALPVDRFLHLTQNITRVR